MLTFPLHNAALDLKGKPPEELPHGLLAIPARSAGTGRAGTGEALDPEAFAATEEALLNDWTVQLVFRGPVPGGDLPPDAARPGSAGGRL